MRTVTPIPYPQPIPYGRMHRCAHPVCHSLLVTGLLAGWLYFSIHTNGVWGFKLAAWLDPHKTGLGLPIAVLTNLLWLPLIPVGALAVYLGTMWRCTGALPQPLRPVVAEALREPGTAATPVLIERVMLTPEDAARRGLPGPVIVERIHYR